MSGWEPEVTKQTFFKPMDDSAASNNPMDRQKTKHPASRPGV
jgi:hypothetical protein